jgi:PAS domain-containing protein
LVDDVAKFHGRRDLGLQTTPASDGICAARAVQRGHGMWNRIDNSLSRKLMFALAGVLALASLLFLALFVGLYRTQLEQERGEASTQLNRLLQVSLENAMLKHDLDGLREIVRRLGEQSGISNVMILNPAGEVRFASQPHLLGRRFDLHADGTCTACHGEVQGALHDTRFMTNELGVEVLRSVNPVRNKPPCLECHGAIAENPINGILFVDYNAGGIRRQAAFSALALAGSGALVLLITLGGAGLLLQRAVLRPVRDLTQAAAALSAGDLDSRVDWRGGDELARLGAAFNHMAGRLQSNLTDLEDKEDFLQSLINAMPDGVRVIDPDFTIIKANSAYCRQIGVTIDQVVGRKCHHSSHGRETPCPPSLVT